MRPLKISPLKKKIYIYIHAYNVLNIKCYIGAWIWVANWKSDQNSGTRLPRDLIMAFWLATAGECGKVWLTGRRFFQGDITFKMAPVAVVFISAQSLKRSHSISLNLSFSLSVSASVFINLSLYSFLATSISLLTSSIFSLYLFILNLINSTVLSLTHLSLNLSLSLPLFTLTSLYLWHPYGSRAPGYEDPMVASPATWLSPWLSWIGNSSLQESWDQK